MDSNQGVQTNTTNRSYIALPPAATSTTTQWHGQPEIEALWILIGAYLLFFGQAGFALLEAGHVRSSLTRQVAVKVLLQICIVALSWWVLGYPCAFGESGPRPNAFVGGKDWFLSDSSSDPDPNQQPELYPLWMLHMAYCCMAVAIASCALAERGRLAAHVVLAVWMSCWVYPVVVHWIWSTEGWLSGRLNMDRASLGANGFIDCAGSCVVHITAGAVGLAAAWSVGARQGSQLDNYSIDDGSSAGSNLYLAVLGGIFVWVSWYGMAPSNVVLTISSVLVAARVSVALTLAAAASCLGVFSYRLLRSHQVNLRAALDGALAGLVAISASCGVVEMYAAFSIGLVGGACYLAGVKLVHCLRVDDPVHVVAVHLVPGLWGAIAPGVFATGHLLPSAGYAGPDGMSGIFYGGDGKQLGIQLLGAVVVLFWSLAMALPMLFGLSYFKLLRLPPGAEMHGWLANEECLVTGSVEDPTLATTNKQSRPGSASGRTLSVVQQQRSRAEALFFEEEQRMSGMPHMVANDQMMVAAEAVMTQGMPPAARDWSHAVSRIGSVAGGMVPSGLAGSGNSYTNLGAAQMPGCYMQPGGVPMALAINPMAGVGAGMVNQPFAMPVQGPVGALNVLGRYSNVYPAAAAANTSAGAQVLHSNGSRRQVANCPGGPNAPLPDGLSRLAGSSNSLADVPLSMQPTVKSSSGGYASGGYGGRRSTSPTNAAAMVAVGGLRNHSVCIGALRSSNRSFSAAERVSVSANCGTRGASDGGGSSMAPSPEMAGRSGSMLVLAPGCSDRSCMYSSGVDPNRLDAFQQQQLEAAYAAGLAAGHSRPLVALASMQSNASTASSRGQHAASVSSAVSDICSFDVAISKPGFSSLSNSFTQQRQHLRDYRPEWPNSGLGPLNGSRRSSPGKGNHPSLELPPRRNFAAANDAGKQPAGQPAATTATTAAAGSNLSGGAAVRAAVSVASAVQQCSEVQEQSAIGQDRLEGGSVDIGAAAAAGVTAATDTVATASPVKSATAPKSGQNDAGCPAKLLEAFLIAPELSLAVSSSSNDLAKLDNQGNGSSLSLASATTCTVQTTPVTLAMAKQVAGATYCNNAQQTSAATGDTSGHAVNAQQQQQKWQQYQQRCSEEEVQPSCLKLEGPANN